MSSWNELLRLPLSAKPSSLQPTPDQLARVGKLEQHFGADDFALPTSEGLETREGLNEREMMFLVSLSDRMMSGKLNV